MAYYLWITVYTFRAILTPLRCCFRAQASRVKKYFTFHQTKKKFLSHHTNDTEPCFNFQVNDDELERELTLTKPPDMAAILAEERRIEQLHRRSYDTDSNYEQDSSHERDSGVELGHVEDWTKQPVSPDMSQHSRQSSEPFGASVTSSEEDEITKKEREIIEVLEKEEQWRYGNNRELNR